MQPCVSAIIPVFNGERYLAHALESILAQTYRPLEILVVDDGSTDRSAEVAHRFGPAIRYIYQANAGAGAARNRGIALSTGDFVAFLDQDDLWAPDKLACQMDVLRADAPVGMVFGLVQQFYSPEWEGRRSALHAPASPVPGYLPIRAADPQAGPGSGGALPDPLAGGRVGGVVCARCRCGRGLLHAATPGGVATAARA